MTKTQNSSPQTVHLAVLSVGSFEWLSSYGIPWPAVTDVVVDDDGTTTVVLLHLDRAARGAQVGGDLAGSGSATSTSTNG